MALSSSQTTFILFILFTLSSFKSSESCGIAVYWGQNSSEGTLQEACASGLYKYANIAFLTTFGSDQTPVLNLDGHCDPSSGTCEGLSDEIHFCQSNGTKVLLSLGGPVGSYNISSPDNAREVAKYLWTTFLAPDSKGPLGNASLDGIDFNIEYPGSPLYWDDLARELAKFSSDVKRVYLAAAPHCPYPDRNLDAAIKTGLFNYVWVQFYNNSQCDYSGGLYGIIKSWNVWSSSLPGDTELYLGLPASPNAAVSGYIPPDMLINYTLPVTKQSKNYGGVMLWNRYYDNLPPKYSRQIFPAVCGANDLKLPSEGLLYSN